MRSCYNVNNDKTAESVDCATLHDGQIFLTGQSLTKISITEPKHDAWIAAAQELCGAALLIFTGSDSSAPTPVWALDVLLEGSDAVPKVSCGVTSVDGERWAGTAESIQGTYLGIEIGDCFDFPTPDANALELPCSQPHEGEMFVLDVPVLDSDLQAPYPSDAEWSDIASFICDNAYKKYTGIDASDLSSDITYTYLMPLEPDWVDIASRLISCAVVNYDGTRLVGSKAA